MNYERDYILRLHGALPYGAISMIAKKLKLPWSTVKDAFVNERSRSKWGNSRAKDKVRIYQSAEALIKKRGISIETKKGH
jgi:ribosomal protein S24E